MREFKNIYIIHYTRDCLHLITFLCLFIILIFYLVKVDGPLSDSSELMVKSNHSLHNNEHEAQFSEDEDDIPLGILSFLTYYL